MPSKKKPSASRCAAILEDDSELDDDKANLVDDSAPAYAALQLGTTHAHRAPAAGVTEQANVIGALWRALSAAEKEMWKTR